DIFSFGVCLYQMITGKRPFQGNTRASVANAILEQEPQRLSVDRPETPPALEWLVKNCLAKDPDERIQTAHDIKLELTRISEEIRIPSTTQPLPRFSSRRWVYGSAAVAALIMIVGTIVIRQMMNSV